MTDRSRPAARSSPVAASPATVAAGLHAWLGRDAAVIAQAPGRVNLIGEHVDYQGGLVLPAAIDRHVFAAAARLDEPLLRLRSSFSGDREVVLPLNGLARQSGRDAWANYAIGVAAGYRNAGHKSGGLALFFDATLPAGAGLSSSAALESATAVAIEAAVGIQLPATVRALLCQQAEHDYAGVPCGIMDQLAVNAGQAGHALLVDCRSLSVTATPLPEGVSMVVVDSGVKHALADGEYAKRRADCEAAAEILGVGSLREATAEEVERAREKLGQRIFRRARHVVSEIARTQQFAEALAAGRLSETGALMAASHASLRDDYEVSCAELDRLVEIANALGIQAARMMGGGFGGSTLQLVPRADAESIAAEIERTSAHQGLKARAFSVVAAAAAGAAIDTD